MSSSQGLDERIGQYLAEGPDHLPLDDREAIARITSETPQRRGVVVPWRGSAATRVLLAAGLIAAIALTTALVATRRPTALVGGPQPTLLEWRQEDVDKPFPAPLRTEPPAGGPLVSAALIDAGDPGIPGDGTWRYVDVTGEVPDASTAHVDLVTVEYNHARCWHSNSLCIHFETATGVSKPIVDPGLEWVAYGVVLDNDADGRPDVRFGVDTMPGDTLRAWATDLHAGTTEVVRRSEVYPDHPRLWEVEFPFWKPPPPDDSGLERPSNWGYAYLHPDLSAPEGRFYVWSAVIRNGAIVAADFMPDVGWLDGRPGEDR